MSNICKRVFSLLLIIVFTLSCGINSLAYEQEDYIVYRGNIAGGEKGKKVAITVYAPGKDEGSISQGMGLETAVACIEQMTTGENGSYRVRFKANHGYGEYKAYIRSEGSDRVEVQTIDHKPPFKLEKLYSKNAGNIFTDDNPPVFYADINNGLDELKEVTLKYTVYEKGSSIAQGSKTLEVASHTEVTEEIEPLVDRYGLFSIVAEIPEFNQQLSIGFSRVRTSEDTKLSNVGLILSDYEFYVQDGISHVLNYSGAASVQMSEADGISDNAVVDGDIGIQVASKEIGRIYYDKANVPIDVCLTNRDADFTGKLSWKVMWNDAILTQGEQDINITQGNIVDIPLDISTGKYGFFALIAEVYAADGDLVSRCAPFRFSVAHAPKDGVRNKDMGVNVHTTPDQIPTNGDPVINMSLAERAGFGFIRNEVWWRYYEKEKGVYAFPKDYAKAVEAARDLNLEIVPILTYGNPIYEPYEHPPASPEILDAFGKFAVNYKRDLGHLTNEVSVWNEYNHPSFNQNGRPPESYADMLKEVYTQLKADNPETFVWGMVTAGVDISFIRKVLKAGGGEYLDGFDVHNYTLKQIPESGGIIRDIGNLKALMKTYGYEDKPIYISENGYTSVGTDGYTDAYQQACYNVRTQFLISAYDLADRYAYYQFNNGAIEDGSTIIFGLVKAAYDEIPYEAKPAYLAISNYNALMIGSEFVEMLKLDSDVTAYRYRLADGSDCFAVWSLKGDNEKTFDLGTDTVIVYDMYGNEKTVCSKTGNYTFSLSEEPVYVTGSFSAFKEGIKQAGSFTEELSKNNMSVTSLEGDEPDDNTAAELVKALAEKSSASQNLLLNFEDEADNPGIVKSRFSDVPYEANEAYASLACFNSLTGGSTFEEKTQSDTAVRYKFTDSTGKALYVQWGKGGTYSIEMPDNRPLEVYDIYGNITYLYSDSGRFDVPAEDTPVYFTQCEDSIAVESNGVAVDSLDDIGIGDNVDIYVKAYDANIAIAAGYKGNVMEFAKILHEINEQGEYMDFSAALRLEKEIEMFKVFVWNWDNLRPVVHLSLDRNLSEKEVE